MSASLAERIDEIEQRIGALKAETGPDRGRDRSECGCQCDTRAIGEQIVQALTRFEHAQGDARDQFECDAQELARQREHTRALLRRAREIEAQDEKRTTRTTGKPPVSSGDLSAVAQSAVQVLELMLNVLQELNAALEQRRHLFLDEPRCHHSAIAALERRDEVSECVISHEQVPLSGCGCGDRHCSAVPTPRDLFGGEAL